MREDYSFLRTPKQVQALATSGALVQVTETEHLALSKVSYPFARPEVRDFIERFATRYHEATGTRLIITSLTRPSALQPKNAHKLSVHPAGMAVDLRVPTDSAARAVLEKSLLAWKRAGALDVTREHSPPHYHVAVFAEKYRHMRCGRTRWMQSNMRGLPLRPPPRRPLPRQSSRRRQRPDVNVPCRASPSPSSL